MLNRNRGAFFLCPCGLREFLFDPYVKVYPHSKWVGQHDTQHVLIFLSVMSLSTWNSFSCVECSFSDAEISQRRPKSFWYMRWLFSYATVYLCRLECGTGNLNSRCSSFISAIFVLDKFQQIVPGKNCLADVFSSGNRLANKSS